MTEQELTTEEMLVAMNGGQPLTTTAPDGGAAAAAEVDENLAVEPTFFGEEFADWKTVRTEIPARLQKAKEMEQQLAEFKAAPVAPSYSDPEVAEFDAFVKNTGNKDFGLFQTIKNATDEMAAIDAIILKQVYDNPKLKGSEARLKEKLIDKYEVNPDITTDETDLLLNQSVLDQDGAKAKAWINELKGKAKVDLPDPEIAKQQKLEKAGKWKSTVEEVLNQVTKIPIPMYDSKTGKVEMIGEFELKGEHKSVFLEPLSQAFAGMELNDQNRSIVGQEFTDRFIARNLPQIIQQAVSLSEAKIREAVEAEYGGATKPKEPGGQPSVSKDQEIEAWLKQ